VEGDNEVVGVIFQGASSVLNPYFYPPIYPDARVP
jgi:hypothetical protein